MTDIVEWFCLDCPQRNPKISADDVRFATDEGNEPLFCPWCGNQTLIKYEDKPDYEEYE